MLRTLDSNEFVVGLIEDESMIEDLKNFNSRLNKK